MKDKPQMPLPGPVTRPRHPAGQIHEGAGTASSPVVGGAKIGQPGTRPSPPLPFVLRELALWPKAEPEGRLDAPPRLAYRSRLAERGKHKTLSPIGLCQRLTERFICECNGRKFGPM